MQTTSKVLMVRPGLFGPNPETAETNSYQKTGIANSENTLEAQAEFDSFVGALQGAGVDVTVVQETAENGLVDAVFPNNWFTTHEDGTLVLYPMLSQLRRLERSNRAIDAIASRFKIERIVDLTHFEKNGEFLEGTGSLVLDRVNRVAYAALSPRSSTRVLHAFCDKLGYKPLTFTAIDGVGKEVYHTNVVLSIGDTFGAACLDAIVDPKEKQSLVHSIESTGRVLIAVSAKQASSFGCNVLQLSTESGGKVVAMSRAAHQTYDEKDWLEHGEIVTAQLETIEKYGGGSARCMIAEVFLRDKLTMSPIATGKT